MADTKSCMKIAFSHQKNCSKHTFAAWPTGQQWAVHHTITHWRRAGGPCPVNNGGQCARVANNHSIPRGKEKTKRNPTTRQEVPRSSPRWAGNLRQRGDTRNHSTGCSKLHSEKGDSARGTEHLKVSWAHWTIVATTASVWIRSGQMILFVFLAAVPTPDQSWDVPIYFFLSMVI